MIGIFKKNYVNINAKEALELIGNEDYQLIDVREAYEFESNHIKGAKLIPLGDITKRLHEIALDKKVILVCASGGRSTSAAKYLSEKGYETYNILGGMMAVNYQTN